MLFSFHSVKLNRNNNEKLLFPINICYSSFFTLLSSRKVCTWS